MVRASGDMRPQARHTPGASAFWPAMDVPCKGRFPEGRLHLLGEPPEIAPVLASFDLLVVPSVLDGRPVVVLEALSLGVPVLAFRVGALPELIQEGETGWLCDPNDPKAFAGRIEHAGQDPQWLTNK
jgi:glycosyltransferase involved in cell wall biosynthesis